MMGSKRLEISDCKVEVRSYVLVPNPSRWNQKGERVIVESPVPDNSTPLEIPVKRYCHGEEQNSVCKLGLQDIERDTSDIYEELQVSQKPSWINAHGVALCRGPSSNGFDYEIGHRFWIYIGSNTNDYTTSVPVINLQTRESGHIAVDHVCWYPQVQGPDEELWTLGGDVRELKLRGSRKFSYWSWVICQKLDGTPSTTKSVEIPAKGVKMGDRWKLAAEKSRLLYEKKYQYMDKWLRCSPPTPPPTPTPRERSDPPAKKIKYDQVPIRSTQSSWGDLDMWKRIVAMATSRNGQQRVLGQSLVQPAPEYPLSIQPSMPRGSSTSPSVSTEDGSIDFDSSDDIPSTSSIEISVLDGWLAGVDGPHILSARILLDIQRKSGTSLVDAGRKAPIEQHTDPETYHIDAITPERYTNLCDLKDSDCVYNFQSTCPHIHILTSKCTITASPSEPSSPPHEHCISRIRPLPGQAGPCLLAEKVDRRHICCYWPEEDRIDWPQNIEQEYDRGKILEANRLRIQIFNRSNWINRKQQFLPYAPQTMKELGYEGCRLLYSDLERGVHDEDLPALRNIRSGSDENVPSIDEFMAWLLSHRQGYSSVHNWFG
jgi:hypothetical protein